MVVRDEEVLAGTVATVSRILNDNLRAGAAGHMEEDHHASHDLVRAVELALVPLGHLVHAHDLSARAHRRGPTICRVAAAEETADAEG